MSKLNVFSSKLQIASPHLQSSTNQTYFVSNTKFFGAFFRVKEKRSFDGAITLIRQQRCCNMQIRTLKTQIHCIHSARFKIVLDISRHHVKSGNLPDTDNVCTCDINGFFKGLETLARAYTRIMRPDTCAHTYNKFVKGLAN